MHLTTEAIVIREYSTGDFDRVLTLLTKKYGILNAYVREARKFRGNLKVSSELLSYSSFVLFKNKENYSVDKADIQAVFMGVRGDVFKLSLASYFCELIVELSPHGEEAELLLRLLLNCLFMLDRAKRSQLLLKPLFELRAMTISGYMPMLVACFDCHCYESDTMCFLPKSSRLVCGDCLSKLAEPESSFPVERGVVTAMRHIIYSEFDKLFNFSLGEQSFVSLGEITEFYVRYHLDKNFKTLGFYKALV